MADKARQDAKQQSDTMQRYYAWQSKIYDATRWSFLFGRKKIIDILPFKKDATIKILEIGCGTGYNIERMARQFPNAQIIGLDASSHMIDKAKINTSAFSGRVSLERRPYFFGESQYSEQMDLILFSYSLTMINPQWRDLILQARRDLRKGGYVAVADFYNSNFQFFKNHMGNHHVRMDGHLTPLLEAEFERQELMVKPAYGGVWHYFMYIGKKKN